MRVFVALAPVAKLQDIQGPIAEFAPYAEMLGVCTLLYSYARRAPQLTQLVFGSDSTRPLRMRVCTCAAQEALNVLGVGEFMGISFDLIRYLSRLYCLQVSTPEVCDNSLFLAMGFNESNLNLVRFPASPYVCSPLSRRPPALVLADAAAGVQKSSAGR